jgi:hypothetical protein
VKGSKRITKGNDMDFHRDDTGWGGGGASDIILSTFYYTDVQASCGLGSNGEIIILSFLFEVICVEKDTYFMSSRPTIMKNVRRGVVQLSAYIFTNSFFVNFPTSLALTLMYRRCRYITT